MVSGKQDIKKRRALLELRELKRLGKSMRLAADGWRKPWQTLLAILMSARTRDEVTIAVGEKLFSLYPTLPALAHASVSDISAAIRSVNFFRTKAKSVRGCAHGLLTRFQGVVPDTAAELTTLPGVGRKTANVYLATIGKSAIGVDTHVAYISRSIGWTKHADPKKIEADLESLFHRRLWRSVNEICVHFGKTYTVRSEKDRLLDQIIRRQ